MDCQPLVEFLVRRFSSLKVEILDENIFEINLEVQNLIDVTPFYGI